MQQTLIAQTLRENPALVERAREKMQAVLTRSATDLEFRRQLLSDSRAALSQHFGREVPEGAQIAFVESAPGTATVVLPDPIDAGSELAESELEAVAGGVSVTPVEWIAFGACLYILGDLLT